jgi:DNA-binding CsgD family transcriptional regulator
MATGGVVLVGREAETRVISDLIAGARRGQAGALMLSGEPGAGKTTLLQWSGESAGSFIRLTVRGAPADATLGFAGLLQIVRPLSGHLESLPAGHATLLRGVCALGQPPDVIDRLGVHVAVLLLLATVAEQTPVLVTVDDVQWLDVESRDALMFTARRLDSDAVAMLFAARAGEPGYGTLVGATGLPTLRLGGLGISAATQMLQEIKGMRPPGVVVSSLVDATGGNPLALVEVARRLTTRQLSGTEPLPAALPLTAPASHAYADVLDRMPAPTLEALGLFALGDGDDLAAIFTAAGNLGIPGSAAISLESMGLLSFEGGRVRLRHALLVAAATARLAPVRLRQMHHAIATALDGAAAESARKVWHLAEATQVPDKDVAAALAVVASDRQSTSSHAAAVAYDRAATLTPDRPTRALRYQAAADAAAMAGYDDWSLELLTHAWEQVDEPAFRARLDHARGVRHIVAGRPRAAWVLLRPSAAVLQPHDPRQAALVLADAALAAFLAGRLEDARVTAARVRQSSTGTEADLAAGIVEGLAALHLGDLCYGLQVMSSSADRPDLPDAFAPVIEYLVPLIIGLTWSGSCEPAADLAETVVGLLRARGAFGLLPAALYASAYVNVWSGRLHRAYLYASEARTLADEGGNRLWQFLATGCLALAEAMRGNPSECRRLAFSAQQRWADVDLWHPRDVEDALGIAALCAGDMPGALRHLESASIPQPLGTPVFGRPTSADLVEAYVRAGRAVPDSIARHIEAPVPDRFPAVAATLWRCRGLVGAGDPGQAFETSQALYADANLPWQQARTLLSFGEQLRRSGRRTDAREQLRRAASLFDETGSPIWADRAAAELAAAGGEAPPSRPHGHDELTPQELHVALAVATGATNREVSSLLFLSPKTIEMHLTRIYRKLGVRSRTDLAIHFAARSPQDQSPARTE